MTTTIVGNNSEAQALVNLSSLGAIVAIPFGNTAAYDLIADFGGELYKVQVKTAKARTGGLFVKLQRSYTIGAKSVYRNYQPGDFDLLVVYSPSTDEIFGILAEECITKSSLLLRYTVPRNGQKKNVLMKDNYLLTDTIQRIYTR